MADHRCQAPRRRVVERREARLYGPDWVEKATACRLRDKNTCMRCGYKPAGRRALPVHHWIPLELARQWNERFPQNHPRNLSTLCAPCHGATRQADDRAKRADFIGWADEVRKFCGRNDRLIERFAAAAAFYGIPVHWLE